MTLPEVEAGGWTFKVGWAKPYLKNKLKEKGLGA
jgi:hypothetical protein